MSERMMTQAQYTAADLDYATAELPPDDVTFVFLDIAAKASADEWALFTAALDRETRADSHALAEHVRAFRNHVGTARAILGQDGRYVTTAERMMADDELAEAIQRADLILIALSKGCQ